MTTDEDNKRLKTELSEMKARHRLEIERVTREKEQEMDEVHKRSVSHEFVHYETFFSRTNGCGLSTNDWKRTRTGERRFSFTTFKDCEARARDSTLSDLGFVPCEFPLWTISVSYREFLSKSVLQSNECLVSLVLSAPHCLS